MQEWQEQEMSNMVWAMATLGRDRPVLLERCAEEALRRGFSPYAPQAISNLVWGFAQLNYCNAPFLTVRALLPGRPSRCRLPARSTQLTLLPCSHARRAHMQHLCILQHS